MASPLSRKLPALLAAPALAVGLQLLPAPAGLTQDAWVVVSLAVLMVIWWITEAIPIPITSLLPLVILPASGVMPIGDAAIAYSSPIVLLLLGGFIIAKSVERWNLHARIALNIVRRAGDHPAAIVGGFLLASTLLSMWISNTATAIMLTPIALSVAAAIVGPGVPGAPFTIAVLLAVAYGCSIGGLATPIGTPTNLIVIGYIQEETGLSISFAQWMAIGLPTVALVTPAAWLVLTRWGLRVRRTGGGSGGQAVVADALEKLGPMRAPERRVLIVFALIAAAWVLRMPLEELVIGGATPFAGLTDHVIAIAGAIALFLVPSGCDRERGTFLLDWETAVQIPWGVALLFGGGLSLAAAISATGLAGWMGAQMVGLTDLPPILMVLGLATFVVFATELMSNVATASAVMPIMGALALAGGISPVFLAFPVAMAATCGFMMPMGTGPNAIAFASGEFSIATMARVGLLLDLLAIVAITLIIPLVFPLVF